MHRWVKCHPSRLVQLGHAERLDEDHGEGQRYLCWHSTTLFLENRQMFSARGERKRWSKLTHACLFLTFFLIKRRFFWKSFEKKYSQKKSVCRWFTQWYEKSWKCMEPPTKGWLQKARDQMAWKKCYVLFKMLHSYVMSNYGYEFFALLKKNHVV